MSDPLRASDADREAAAARLRAGLGDGRLSVEELEERVEAAYRARTRVELDRLVADLPAGAGALAAPADPAGPGGLAGPAAAGRVPVRPGEGGSRWIVSVMGGSERRGRWRLAPRCRVINVMGATDLDLGEVELAAARVELTVFSLMGGADIKLPDSLNVEVSKFALMGGHDVDLGNPPVDPGGPILSLRLVSVMGGAQVRRSSGPGRPGPGRRRRRLESRRGLGRGGRTD